MNNRPLEKAILGHTAKCAERYGVKLYAFAIEGNHVHGPALFPEGNRAAFMRDLNSSIARAVDRYTPEYPGGRFWARRYSQEFLPGDEDIEEQFFYTVLQPVQDGLVERISDYPGYNCFHDAVLGIEREFKVFKWAEYNAAKRYNRSVAKKDFVDIVKLRYQRLPGYEQLSQREYAKLMNHKLEERRQEILKKRKGLPVMGREALLKVRRGALPNKTKTSTIDSHRPRVLSVCHRRRAECTAWYFAIHFAYKDASRRYRAGEEVVFPPGTYPPARKIPVPPPPP